MTDCQHRAIQAWRFEDDGTPAGLWSCVDCARRFVPLDVALETDAERWRKLRDTPATYIAHGPLRDWLFARPGDPKSLDQMADELPALLPRRSE